MNANILTNAVLVGGGLIATAIGVVLYVVQLRQGLRADASKKWPTVPGTITASALEKSAQGRWRYRAAIAYRYRVGARDYRSDRVFWGGNEGRQKHMASVVADFPAAAKVRVYYDPQNPADAVLDPVQKAGSRPTVVYAMGMITLGLFALGGGLYALLQ